MQKLKQLFFLAMGLYGAVVTLFLLIREITGEQWVIIALLNSFTHLFLMLALVLIVVCILARQYLSAAALLPAVAVFLVTYGTFFLPQAVPHSTGPSLRLLTFNVYSKRADPPQLAGVIKEADADIVLLQELDADVAGHFEDAFQNQYPYRIFRTPEKTSNAGMGVMSRYPILSEQYWIVHRGHQQVTVEFYGTNISIYNSRPIFPFEGDGFARQAEEVVILLERTSQDVGPVILAGDFNMSDQSENYQQITKLFTDAYREVGWGMGFTFPADNPDIDSLPYQVRELMKIPLVRLDYVFHNEHFQTTEAQVLGSSGGSDHRPLLVVLSLESNPVMHKMQKKSKIYAFGLLNISSLILHKETGVFCCTRQN